MRRQLFLSALALAAVLSPASAYVRLYTPLPSVTGDPPIAPLTRPEPTTAAPNNGIQFYINNALVAGLQSSASCPPPVPPVHTVLAAGSDPVGAARKALAAWNAVGGSVNFLPLQSTPLLNKPDDGKMVIALATTADDLSAVGSAVAITATIFTTGAGPDPYNSSLQVVNGSIVDSDILLNPCTSFNTDGTGSASGAAIINGNTNTDLQAVLTHELGHALGANHTGVLGATMFQYAALDQRFPSTDDATFVRSVYPLAKSTAFATISGTITAGGSPVVYGLVTMVDTAQQITLGALTAADGTYSIQAQPGSYIVYAEPFNSLVQPGNLYLDPKLQAPLATKFQSTIYGGVANPTVVTATAGATATASFSVTSGTTTLAFPLIGFGAAGKTGDVSTFSLVQGPQLVPSGSSLDLAFTGTGYDATLTTSNFQVFGGGITVQPGSLRVDSTAKVQGLPIIRVTLNIAAVQTQSLASIFINKGGNTLSLSGVLVVTPPLPALTSASVVNAASYLGSGGNGAVSPGGIYSVYATTGTSFLGPAAPVSNAGFDSYKQLPTTLAGVTVTFDGVPAPLFFVYGGQINLQVPYEIAGKTSTKVVVSFYGASNPAVTVPVFALQPSFFTVTPLGNDSIATNQDFSLNTAAAPAKQGSFVTIYGTGVGVTPIGAATYGLQTGVGAPGPPGGFSGNFTCTYNGATTVPAYFAGWTPGSIGLAQFTVQIPAGVTGKASIRCTDTATGAATQVGTVYAQ